MMRKSDSHAYIAKIRKSSKLRTPHDDIDSLELEKYNLLEKVKNMELLVNQKDTELRRTTDKCFNHQTLITVLEKKLKNCENDLSCSNSLIINIVELVYSNSGESNLINQIKDLLDNIIDKNEIEFEDFFKNFDYTSK